MCVFTSQLIGENNRGAQGCELPALTAAVQPACARPANPTHPTMLDRNWNNGFFLHTQYRGDAFVELIDRELHLIVRHEYPATLLRPGATDA